jgi:hypothetical protein
MRCAAACSAAWAAKVVVDSFSAWSHTTGSSWAPRAHAVVTLDSDHNRNALSAQLVEELGLAMQSAAHDDDVLAGEAPRG